ncbi:MAG: nucleotidyltransferase [Caldisericia bacterium]
MAMDDYFASLLSEKIEPSKADMNKAFRHRELRKKLEDSQILNKGADEDMYSFLTGSYVRHTAIHPFNDVDFFIVLERENFPDLSPGALLTKVENVLKDVLQKYEICKQSHSVKIEYPDGFSIDVIPAFEKSLDMFEIPEVFEDEEERWINSNPKIHQELLTQANEQFDGKLVPLIKLLKFWKNNKCNILKSFHLELLVIEIFKNIAFESFSDSIHYFLFEVQKYLQKGTIIDPANSDNYVDDYLGADSVEIINRVKDGLEICMEAAEYEDSGLDYKAKEVWNEFFGINSEGLVQYQKQNHELRIPNDIRLMKGVLSTISVLLEKRSDLIKSLVSLQR